MSIGHIKRQVRFTFAATDVSCLFALQIHNLEWLNYNIF